MRRFAFTAIGAAVAAFFVGSAGATGTSTLVLGPLQGNLLQQPVEQWTDQYSDPSSRFPADHSQWVNNPTGCAWDVDDTQAMYQPNASLAGNTSVSGTYCEVADVNPTSVCIYSNCQSWSHSQRGFQVYASAASSDLNITVCYSPQLRCFNPRGVYDSVNRDYRYRACMKVSYTYSDPALSLIPGSNGDAFDPVRGLGVMTYMTVTFTNTTGRTIKPIFAAVQMVGAGGSGLACDLHTSPYDTFSYPFASVVSA